MRVSAVGLLATSLPFLIAVSCGNSGLAASLTPEQQAVVKKYHITEADQAALFGGRNTKAAPEQYAGKGGSKANKGAAPVSNPLPCARWKLFLRADFKDIGTFGCPGEPTEATGAQLSVSENAVSGNQVWSAHGTAGLIYTYLAPETNGESSLLFEKSLATYVTMDRALNSKLSSKDSDTIAIGGVGELGFEYLFRGEQYYRLSGGFAQDNIKNTQSAGAIFEWIPVYDRLHLGVGDQLIPGINYRISPELVAKYDHVTGENQVLAFSGRESAIRVGPEFAAGLYGQSTSMFKKFNLNVVFDSDFELLSKQWLPYFSASLSYNLDDAGHVALSGWYKNGKDPLTGSTKNEASLELTTKF